MILKTRSFKIHTLTLCGVCSWPRLFPTLWGNSSPNNLLCKSSLGSGDSHLLTGCPFYVSRGPSQEVFTCAVGCVLYPTFLSSHFVSQYWVLCWGTDPSGVEFCVRWERRFQFHFSACFDPVFPLLFIGDPVFSLMYSLSIFIKNHISSCKDIWVLSSIPLIWVSIFRPVLSHFFLNIVAQYDLNDTSCNYI